MIVNAANLDALRVGFKSTFDDAFGEVKTLRDKVAEVVPSSAKQNAYGWLGEMPGMREWIGPRVVNNLKTHDYTIANKSFEMTVGVDRDDIEDDTLGTYTPRFKALGRAAARGPELLVWQALADGWTKEAYDKQYFFDTDHPVIKADGTVGTVANTDGGSGTAWYLLATNEVIKPIIFQERKKAEFVYKDQPGDDNVFHNRQFVYGADARHAVGYGFWQMAWGSKQALNAANFAAARAAMQSFKGDHGAPLGIMPNLLVVPPTLEEAGRKILMADTSAGGEANVWRGSAELLVVPWLS